MMRYNSGKKEREDSVKREEYGLSTTTRKEPGSLMLGATGGGAGSHITTTANDMFSKTTSVNNYTVKSISGGNTNTNNNPT